MYTQESYTICEKSYDFTNSLIVCTFSPNIQIYDLKNLWISFNDQMIYIDFIITFFYFIFISSNEF